jgi:hypothetical protein
VATDLNSGVSSTSQNVYQYQNGNLVGSVIDVGTPAERQYTFDYYPDQENKLRDYEETVAAFPGNGPTPSRHLVKMATLADPNRHEMHTETRHYTYEYNAKGFPIHIHSVRTQAGTTSTSETVFEYNCE